MDKLKAVKKRFGYHEKRAILEEHFNSGLSLSALSRKHQIHPVTLYSWKRSLCMSDKDENQSGLVVFQELCQPSRVDSKLQYDSEIIY